MGPMDNSEHILVLHSLTMLNQDFTGVIQKSVTTGFTQYSFSLAYELKKKAHFKCRCDMVFRVIPWYF